MLDLASTRAAARNGPCMLTVEDSIIWNCRSRSLNWPTNCRSYSGGQSDHVALSIGLMNARGWPNQPRSMGFETVQLPVAQALPTTP